MSTYLGWTVVTMPTTPAAPQAVDFSFRDIVAANTSPYSDQQQTQNWGVGACECSASFMMTQSVFASLWQPFLVSLQGMNCVFQFPSAVCSAYPELFNLSGVARYFRLKENARKLSLDYNKIYRFTLDLREVL